MVLIATGFADREVVCADADPTSTAVNADKGSLILWNDDWYFKTSDGNNTDVTLMPCALVSQAAAEAGTGTLVRFWTPERVKQAIDALGGGGFSTSTKSASFTAVNNTVYLCDTNAAASDIVVTNIVSPSAGNWFEVILKTDHATRKLTVNGKTLIISGDYVRCIYDGAAWNNETHLISSKCKVTRDAVQPIDSGTATDISFDTEAYDIGSLSTVGAGESTTIATIRRAGKYLITAAWGLAGIDDDEGIQGDITVNGTAVRSNNNWSAGTTNVVLVSDSIVLDLSVGDVLKYNVRHSEGATQNTQTLTQRKPTATITEILP